MENIREECEREGWGERGIIWIRLAERKNQSWKKRERGGIWEEMGGERRSDEAKT